MLAAVRTDRLVRWWLIALNLGLIGAGTLLALLGTQRALFLIVLVPLAFAPFSYARARLQRALASVAGTGRAWLIAAIGVLLDAVMVAQLLTARAADAPAWLNGSVMGWIGPVWFSAHVLLFFAYAVAGVGHALRVVLRRSLARPQRPAAADLALGRRAFLQQFGIVGAAAPFAISLSGVSLSYDFRVDEHEIELPHWPRSLDGLRVAHLSDIHVGGGMNRQRLRTVAALTNASRPDLVLHSGDFLTHRSGDFDAPLYEALSSVHAPYGQWACLGNHDFDDPDRLERRLREAGVTLLRDRVATVAVRGQALEIGGIDFQFTRAERSARYRQILAAWPARRAPRLLLNHDPGGFAELPDDCADLVLSGHTHGGHIGIQLGPEHALTVIGLAGIPDQGVFRRGDLRLFVTRCVGFYGYPMRVGIPPEIALLVLRAPRRQPT
jgi:predicted MPP superfamily phosphohydrolase